LSSAYQHQVRYTHLRVLERLRTHAACEVAAMGMQMMKIHARLHETRIVKSFNPGFQRDYGC